MKNIFRVCFLVAAFVGLNAATFAQGTRLSQLERIDTIQNSAQNTRYMPITLFAGEVDHKGQTFTVPGTQSYRSVDSIARHLPLMDFKGQWISTCYEQFDVVVDGCWTMVADTFTCERAGPIEDGLATYTFQDTHSFTILSDPSFVKYGQKYTFSSPGWVREIRVNVPALGPDVSYRFIIADITDPNVPIINVFNNPDLVVDDWAVLDLGNYIIRPNGVIVFYAEALNEASSSTITGEWVYEGASQAGAPTTQRWNQNNQSNLVRVSVTDWLGANRQADLLSILPGAVGTFTQQAVPERTNQYEVQQAPTLNGSHVEFVVLNLGSTGGGVQVGQLCDVEWVVPVAAPTEYPITTGYWNTNQPTWATVEGVLEFNGIDQGATLDGFGVDLQFQPGIVPEDWSILAYSCSGGSGGISGGAADGNGMFDFDNQFGTWQVKNWNITGGNSMTTQTAGERWKIGQNSVASYQSFYYLSSLGPVFEMVSGNGTDLFTLSHLAGFDTKFYSDAGFTFGIQSGSNDIMQMNSTRITMIKEIKLDSDLNDISNLPGTLGEVLKSNGPGLGVSWGAAGGSSLWQTDANGIIPIPPVDNIGVAAASNSSYSINAGLKMQVAYAVGANDELLRLSALNSNDAFIEFAPGTDQWAIGGDNSINRFVISSSTNLGTPRLQIDNSGILYLSAYTTGGGITTGLYAGLLSHSTSGVVQSVDLGSNGQVLTMNGTTGFTWTTPGGGGDPDQTLSFTSPSLTISGTGGNTQDLSDIRMNVLEDGLNAVPNAQSMDFMTGLNVAGGGADNASIYLDFNEFPTITTLVGNELFPFYDPNFTNERKITADNLSAFIGGGGGGGIYGGSGTVPVATTVSIPNGITFNDASTATININGGGTTASLVVTGQALDIISSNGIRMGSYLSVNGPSLFLGPNTEFRMGTDEGAIGEVLTSRGTGLSPEWSPPVLAAQSIDPSEIDSGTTDFVLPDITTVGQIHIYENNSGGGPSEKVYPHVSDQIGTGALGGSVNISNDNAIMFIAVSLSRWRQF